MIDYLDIENHKIIIRKGLDLIPFLNDEDKNSLNSIINNSKNILKELTKENNIALNATKREIEVFKISSKRYIRTDFIEPSCERVKQIDDSLSSIKNICNTCRDNEENYIYGTYDLCSNCQDKVNYINKIYYVQWDRRKIIKNEFFNALDNTVYPKELIGRWILLRRKINSNDNTKHLEHALKGFIRDEIINEFREQNKQLIKKYSL